MFIKKFFYVLFYILISCINCSAFADVILHGNIRSDRFETMVYSDNMQDISSCHDFPFPIYSFDNIKMFDLKYDKQVPRKNRLKEINDFIINLKSYLKLKSPLTDKNGTVKFILYIKGGNYLTYTGHDYEHSNFMETGGLQLMNGNGMVMMEDGSRMEFIIEGKIEKHDGVFKWTSLNKNPYFDIDVKSDSSKSSSCRYKVKLIRLKDNVPVIISTD